MAGVERQHLEASLVERSADLGAADDREFSTNKEAKLAYKISKLLKCA